jgi:hypothetical protein
MGRSSGTPRPDDIGSPPSHVSRAMSQRRICVPGYSHDGSGSDTTASVRGCVCMCLIGAIRYWRMASRRPLSNADGVEACAGPSNCKSQHSLASSTWCRVAIASPVALYAYNATLECYDNLSDLSLCHTLRSPKQPFRFILFSVVPGSRSSILVQPFHSCASHYTLALG